MNMTEEVIDATLEPDGTLRLAQQPQLPPGPVRVTIQAVAPTRPRRTLADVIRKIAAEQQARGYSGRTAAELRTETELQAEEDDERDRELEAARSPFGAGGVGGE
jgi:hypothetical protein